MGFAMELQIQGPSPAGYTDLLPLHEKAMKKANGKPAWPASTGYGAGPYVFKYKDAKKLSKLLAQFGDIRIVDKTTNHATSVFGPSLIDVQRREIGYMKHIQRKADRRKRARVEPSSNSAGPSGSGSSDGPVDLISDSD